MPHPEPRRSPRTFVTRAGVAALGLAVGVGGLGWPAPAHAAVIDGLAGTGTAADPVVIDSAADLDLVAARVNADHATYGSLSYRLDADVDYAGGTFETFRQFSGTFDGNGHAIRDLTLRPGTIADAADAAATQTGFVQVLSNGTIADLTLEGLTSATTGSTTARVQQGGFVGRSSGGTITGSSLVDSSVTSSPNTDNSAAVGGFVGKTVGTATTMLTDNVLRGTSVSGDKRVGGVVGWANIAATVERNLVVDTDVAHAGSSGAGAAFLVGHTVCAGDVGDNVVVSGSISQVGPASYGWVRTGTGCTSSDNLVNSANNIDPAGPVGHTAAPDPNPFAVYWQGSTLLSASGWTAADLGTYTSPAALATQTTYEGLGWDFDTVWQWDDEAQRPVLRAAETPVVEPPVITVGTASISYQVGSTPTAADALARLGASVDRGTLALDLGDVDFTTPGTYPATVTASDGDDVAAPVAVTIVVSELDGAGTETEPYVVASAADLDAAADMVNDDPAQTGAAAAHYELAADVDYAGGTFETFRRFSGVLDGNGHEISDLTLRPGTFADAGDADATQTGFVQVLSGTITDLTLRGLRSVTAGASTDRVQQGGFAGRAAGATITGSALIGSTVSSADNTDNSSAVGGLVGKATVAGTTLADNLLAGVTVNGDKRVGGALGWANVAADVRRTLVLDTSVTQNGSSGAGAAFVTGHSVCAGTVSGNVVLSGTIRQTSPASYGWIAAADTCTGTGNLVNASNNIDVDAPVGHTSAPNPNPYAVSWSGSTTLDTAGAWTRGVLGAYASRDDLAQRATYEAVGYDLSADGAWRWDDERRHPVPAGVAFPSVDVVVDLAGGTDGGANPTTHGFALDAALVNPTREGYVFAGWTGSGIEGTSLAVTLPRYPAGDLHYTATWTPTDFVISYDLAGGTVPAGNPVTYSVDSAAFTLVNPARDGYTFAGWSGTGIDGTSTTVTVARGSTGARSFTAVWTPIGYPVTYDLAGGTASGDNPATYTVESAAFTLANPTRTGYAFAGWTGTGLTSSTATVVVPAGSLQARSYVATWTPVVFHIVYGIEDDADFSGPVPGTYTIESAAITVPTPVRPGHVFAGWTGTDLTSPTMAVTIAAGSTGTRTYTPTWHRINTITYRLAGGRLARTNPTTYLETSPAFTLANPTRPGYRFAGWAGLGTTSTRLTVPTGTTGDLVLTATWTPLARARSAVQVRWVRKPTRQRAGRLAFAVPAVSGYPTPTGRVTVRVTGKVTRTVTTGVRAGWTTVTLPRKLPAGRYRVTATFAGNAFYAPATAKTLTFRVKK